jgi:hypothetical protein
MSGLFQSPGGPAIIIIVGVCLGNVFSKDDPEELG